MTVGKIVDLGEAREARTPHLAGPAKCISCGKAWVAVVPVGATWLKCPECSLDLGRLTGQVERPGLHRHCACGTDLFYIHEMGPYCARCGLEVPS